MSHVSFQWCLLLSLVHFMWYALVLKFSFMPLERCFQNFTFCIHSFSFLGSFFFFFFLCKLPPFCARTLSLWIFWLPYLCTDVDLCPCCSRLQWLRDSPAETQRRVASPQSFLDSCSRSRSENFLLALCPDTAFKQSTRACWNLPLVLCFLVWRSLSLWSKSHSSHRQPSGDMLNAACCAPTLWGINFPSMGVPCHFLHLTRLLDLAFRFFWWIVPLLVILGVFFCILPLFL